MNLTVSEPSPGLSVEHLIVKMDALNLVNRVVAHDMIQALTEPFNTAFTLARYTPTHPNTSKHTPKHPPIHNTPKHTPTQAQHPNTTPKHNTHTPIHNTQTQHTQTNNTHTQTNTNHTHNSLEYIVELHGEHGTFKGVCEHLCRTNSEEWMPVLMATHHNIKEYNRWVCGVCVCGVFFANTQQHVYWPQ